MVADSLSEDGLTDCRKECYAGGVDTTAAPTIADNLSTLLREETLEAHETAERTRFVGELMGGELPIEAYAALVTQHRAIYAALEAAVAANTDTRMDALFDPVLNRVPAIERDLAFLAERYGVTDVPVLDATRRYADHLATVATTSSVALLAHHYVRYLGDLSGGQVIGRVLARTYGFDGNEGTEFYRFTELASPKAFKDRYRVLLDELDLDAAERDALVAEVNVAYRCNTEVFDDLAMPWGAPVASAH